MRSKEFAQLASQLLPLLPGGFAVKGSLLYYRPVTSVLKGFHFEGSSFDRTSFYVSAFFLPLFVPTKHLYFTFGTRLRVQGADRWSAEVPAEIEALRAAVKDQERRFLAHIKNAEDVARSADIFAPTDDPYVRQARGYAWARAGKVASATPELDKLISQLDSTVSWQLEMRDRAQLLRVKLLNEPADAQHQLDAWESETRRNLRL